jgi:four helix bundle protein
MDNKQFAKILEQRTKDFAIRVIHLSTRLPATPEGKAIRNQIVRSATSVGANYREANRSRSKADFKNRIALCESEASETQYWMEIIGEMNWLSAEQLKGDFKECTELLALFTSISRNRSTGA